MHKRVYIVLAVVLVMLAGVIAWQVLREREPVYQGRSLSNWLAGYEPLPGVFVLGGPTVGFVGAGGGPPGYHFDSRKVDAAVRQIGTNAVPTLFRMLRAKDSALRRMLVRFVRKHMTTIRMNYTPDGALDFRTGSHVMGINLTPSEAWNFRAVAGFRALGGEASNAVPKLIEMYKHTPGSGPWGPGAALGVIGPAAGAAIPSLLLNVGNTNAGAREIAVRVQGEIHSQSQLVVPVLIAALHDPTNAVQYEAFLALGRYGKEAKAAVPALVGMLNDRDEVARVMATNALKAIDPEATVKAGVK